MLNITQRNKRAQGSGPGKPCAAQSWRTHAAALTSALDGKARSPPSRLQTQGQQDRSGKSEAANSDLSRCLSP